MPLHLRFIFLIVSGGVSFGLSAYALNRFALLLTRASPSTLSTKDLGLLTEPLGWGLSAGLVLCYFLVGSVLPARGLRWLGWLSGLWMGQIALTLIFATPLHLIEWGGVSLEILGETGFGVDGARLALFCIEGGMVLGVWGALRAPALREVTITAPTIHTGLDGARILQLSDVHIGPTVGGRFVERLHTLCASLSPDLIVMTGDLVDGHPRYLGDEVKRFLALGEYAEHGLYLITGNHEYISGAQDWVDFLRREGGRVLENEHVTLNFNGDQLQLIGVEDWDANRFDPQRAPQLDQALERLEDQAGFKLLLAHQPKAAPEASERGIDLLLSGHTHGGQIFPFNFFVYLDQPYNRGLYQLDDLTLYVNEGTGYWGPPLRLGTRSEVTLFTLKSSQSE